MTQSPEYPDLRWMPPKSWTDANRTSVQLVVIHTTEGSEGPGSAEDGAAYDQRRTDGTSTHYFHDSNSTVQCVRTADQAHAARAQGNRRGIQHELCGRAGQGGTGWADPVSQGTLRQAAKQAARDARKWGIPVRHLTVAQVADGAKGFCGHVDITNAFPQDHGTHTDPGKDFPWSQFLDMVRAELASASATEEDDMPTAQEIAAAVWAYPLDNPQVADDPTNPGADDKVAGTWLRYVPSFARIDGVGAKVDAVLAAVKALPADVLDALADEGQSDEQTAAVLKAALGDRAAAVGALLQA